jgi:hypothetical protein
MAAKLVFRVHALRRMFERQISPDDVRAVIGSGRQLKITRMTSLTPAVWF